MTVYPNVKLNLGLRVLGTRPDGYHGIQTVFLPHYGFSDTLEIVPSQVFGMDITGPEYTGWDPSEDLCARAWRLLRADFGIPPVHISLEKTSPVGAGLGGGSADGAFTLMALSDIFSLGLPRPRLAEYASLLGSDCAFFIFNAPRYATGRGEVMEPVELPLDGLRFEVAVPPGVHVSTKEAYAGLPARCHAAILPDPPAAQERESLCDLLLSTPVAGWKYVIVNDFEASVFPAHPEIAALKEDFYARGAVYAAMSGSGSSVFGVFNEA